MSTVYKGKNAQIIVSAIDVSNPVAWCESASLEITVNLEPAYSLSSARPRVLEGGNEEITGTLTGYWINTEFIDFLGMDANWALSQSFHVYMKASGASSAPYIYAYNCKGDRVSFDISQDGFLMHDLDFRCLSYDDGTNA